MKKRLLSILLALCLFLSLTPILPFAAASEDPYSSQRSGDGAIRPSKLIFHNGYYYFLYDEMTASITRHKADGSDNTVLYSTYGFKDLANIYYITGEKASTQLRSMLIYNDRIYVSVLLGAYRGAKLKDPVAAILSMKLDGTDAKEVLRTKDTTPFRNWCIYKDQLCISGWNCFYTAKLDGSGLQASPSFSGYTTTQHNEGSGSPGYFYNGVCYFAQSTTAGKDKYILYQMDVASNTFSPCKTTTFRVSSLFAEDGYLYFGRDTNGDKWRTKLGGENESQYLGNKLSYLKAYQGDLYYMNSTNQNEAILYKSAGLDAPKNPVALTNKGAFRPEGISVANGMAFPGASSIPVVFATDGSKKGFDLHYLDKNIKGSSIENKGFEGSWMGYVVRPCFTPHVST